MAEDGIQEGQPGEAAARRPAEASRTHGPKGSRRKLWHALLALYLLLLAVSSIVRLLRPEPDLPPGYQSVTVQGVDGSRRLDTAVRLAYLEWPWRSIPPAGDGADTGPIEAPQTSSGALPAGGPSMSGATSTKERPPVILLVHGSPGGADNFYRLGPLLTSYGRVLAPDLPGFGVSTVEVADYSILAHSDYLIQMLDSLGIAAVHAVGFSMGGGVVLHLAENHPDRVQSVTLLSAIGVQEAELLGQYHLNHAVHALQLAGLWLLRTAVPHFGALDSGGLDVAYARNFYDTDQRPLRRILQQLELPMLVVHGKRDVLVPAAAAREHYRIVPHSELVMTEANHFMVFRSPESLRVIGDFVRRVEAGEAARRSDATAERLAMAADPKGFRPPSKTGLALILAFFLIAVATLVSEDLACIATGLVVAQGGLTLLQGAGACFLGIYFGDLMLYGCGRLGHRWLRRRPFSWFISTRDVERSRQWFERRGAIVILLSRFLPGTRLPTYVAAGMLRLGFFWFALNLLLPVALWTPFLVALSQKLGERFFDTFESFQRYALPGFIAALVSVWCLLLLIKTLGSRTGRRRAAGWWRRRVRWEYWPPWLFYPPVVVYVLWLGIRHRCLTAFTAVNPGMPAAGGFIGESKSTILEALDDTWVAPFRRLGKGSSEQRHAAVQAFRQQHGLSYPIVLKPDAGQRGAGVTIVHHPEDIATFLENHPEDAIVQQYVAGPELGIFYVRHPSEPRGRIFSVTEKRMASVVGDGERSLQQLIYDDPALLAMSPTYLALQADHLDEIPAAGQEVELTELGTHCRGAIFLDGGHLITAALEEACDRLGQSFEGFFFGRFDARAPSLQAFRDGRGFQVLELNGVTSEATHIYDPGNSLWQAYGVLFEQWRLAFEIGTANRRRGAEVTSVAEIFRLLLAARSSRPRNESLPSAAHRRNPLFDGEPPKGGLPRTGRSPE